MSAGRFISFKKTLVARYILVRAAPDPLDTANR